MDLFSYANLDRIADAFLPLQALLALACIVLSLARAQFRRAALLGAVLVLGVVLVYGMMGADNHWRWWPAAGLDYSTHTAAALALLLFLVVAWRALWPTWLVLLLAYLGLCLYQRYHPPADIVATAAYLLPLLYLGTRLILGNWRLRLPA